MHLDHNYENYRKEQVVYETYDLLSSDDRVEYNNKDIKLYYPSDINNLSKIRFRVFKPKKQILLEGYNQATNICELKPSIFKLTTNDFSSIYKPNYQLYAYSQNIAVPITETFKFTLPFSESLDFVQLINLSIRNTMDRFQNFGFGYIDESGALQITKGSKTFNPRVIEIANNLMDVICRPYVLDSGGTEQFLLVWSLDLRVAPVDIYHISEYKTIDQLHTSYRANPGQDEYFLGGLAHKIDNYDYYYLKYIGSSDNYYLILSSPYMKNLSQIVYVEGYEPTVDYKEMDASTNNKFISLKLMDQNENILTKDEVKAIYNNIWVSIDYVFANYIN